MQDVLTHKADSRKMEEIDELELDTPQFTPMATEKLLAFYS